MKWFRHNSRADPFVETLLSEFGHSGYVVFYIAKEIISQEFSIESPGKVTVFLDFFRRKVRLSLKKTQKILDFCESECRLFATIEGKKITLNCPELKEDCDEWTRRELRRHSGGATESLEKNPTQSKAEQSRLESKAKAAPSSQHFSDQLDGQYLEQIKDLCTKLQKKPNGSKPFNSFAWVQQQVKSRKHPGAMLKALQSLLKHWETTRNPVGYLNAIMKTESGNFYYQDHLDSEGEKEKQTEGKGQGIGGLMNRVFKSF